MSRAPSWTAKRLTAAITAIEAMLAGGDNEGDWPADVKREDLEAASARLKYMQERRKRISGRLQ